MEELTKFIETNIIYIGGLIFVILTVLLLFYFYMYKPIQKPELDTSEKISSNLSTLATKGDDTSTIDMLITEIEEESK